MEKGSFIMGNSVQEDIDERIVQEHNEAAICKENNKLHLLVTIETLIGLLNELKKDVIQR